VRHSARDRREFAGLARNAIEIGALCQAVLACLRAMRLPQASTRPAGRVLARSLVEAICWLGLALRVTGDSSMAARNSVRSGT